MTGLGSSGPAMVHTIPTFRCYPSHRKTDLHLHSPTIAAARHAILRNATSHNYVVAAIPAAREQNSNRRPLLANVPAALASSSTVELLESSNVVRKFYDGINRRDLASVEDLIALNCVYEDLVFPRPFVGRKAILQFFKQFIDSFSADLQFAIDDISEEDTSAVGVTWHLEWKGKSFPFSKGCSFYRLDIVDGQRQIVYGRDCVEPAVKPGETALPEHIFLDLDESASKAGMYRLSTEFTHVDIGIP